MKKLIAILMAVAILLSLAACVPPQNDPTVPVDSYTKTDTAHPERYGGVLRYAQGGMGPTLDPYGQGSWTTFAWAMNIFETPLALGDDGKFYPLVCDYEMSADGKTITLWVRDGVCFSNGDPVEIEDILASLERGKLMTSAVNTYLWDILDRYEIKDNKLTFYMKEYNMQTMTQVFANFRPNRGIMPKEICEKYGSNLIDDPNDVIGTGPYKLVADQTEIGVKVTMARNEKYTICKESPDDNGYASPKYQYLDGMVYYCVAQGESQNLALLGDELDMIGCTNEKDFQATFAAAGGFEQTANTSTSAYYIFFNITGNRQVQDVNLRKAIAACIDYTEIMTSLFGSLSELNSNVLLCGDKYQDTFKNTDYYNANSITKAKEYLAKSNYDGSELKLLGIGGIEYIAEAMKAAGINCSYTEPDNATLIAAADDPSMDWDFIFRANPLGNPVPSFHATYYQNWGNARATELVGLLGTQVMGSAESQASWQELDALMVEECPFVMMFCNVIGFAHPEDLNYNNSSVNRMYWNAYWEKNVDQHNKW